MQGICDFRELRLKKDRRFLSEIVSESETHKKWQKSRHLCTWGDLVPVFDINVQLPYSALAYAFINVQPVELTFGMLPNLSELPLSTALKPRSAQDV